jgi:hypothetical protein
MRQAGVRPVLLTEGDQLQGDEKILRLEVHILYSQIAN